MAFHCFRIYQLKDVPNTIYAFRSWEEAQRANFSFDDYKKVYMECLETEETNIMNFLEDILAIFNNYDLFKGCAFEEPFIGHSLSVSDIVKVENKYYYVDDFGFKDITDFI